MGTEAAEEASHEAAVERAVAELPDAVVVRRYLLSVTDPDLTFDEHGSSLADQVSAATDVLDRLARTGALIRHRERWRRALELAFVQRGGPWAKAAGACPASMERLGVPSATLEAAGLR